jgi:hypothetical protein
MLHAHDAASLKELSKEELEMFDLRLKLETSALHEEQALQAAEAEFMETIALAAADADHAQRDCDMLRSKTRQRRSALQLTLQKNKKIEAEVRELEERIAAHRREMETAAADAALASATAAVVSSTTAANASTKNSSLDSTNQGNRTFADLQQMTNAVRAEMDMEETAVGQLRRRHARSQAQLKAATADVQKLRESSQRLQQRQTHLQEQQLLLAAAQANPAHREALSKQQEYQTLLKQQRAQEEQIRSERLEQQALVLHLLDGFGDRTQKLCDLRRRMLRAAMTQDDSVSDRAGSSPSRTPEFASELLRENEQRRADVVSTIANVAKERDALHQYISVLSQRLEAAISKCNQLDA